MFVAPGAMAAPMKEHRHVPTRMVLRAWNVSEAKDCGQTWAVSRAHDKRAGYRLNEGERGRHPHLVLQAPDIFRNEVELQSALEGIHKLTPDGGPLRATSWTMLSRNNANRAMYVRA